MKRERDVGMSHKESPLAAQWLTKPLAGKRGGCVMNADQKYFNIVLWSRAEMCREKEALTFSSQTQWRFYFVSFARAPVLGETHPNLSRWLLCETKKGSHTPLQPICTKASSPRSCCSDRVRAFLYPPDHSAYTLMHISCVVCSAGMH